MSDKRPHIKPEALAALIRQYLAGELDDKAMHDLERQALDDPFLADALEGYALHPPEQQSQQADLTFRLEARIAPKQAKVRIMYYRWAAAAAILLLMCTAGWFLLEQQRTPVPVAGVQLPVLAPVADSAPQTEHSTAPAAELASADQPVKADQLAKKTAPPAPAVPNTYKLKEQKAALQSADADTRNIDPAPAAAAPVTPAPVPLALNRKEDKAFAAKAEKQAESTANYNLITPAEKQRQQHYIGQPDSSSKGLNEVVVVGYGAQKKQSVSGSTVVIRGMSTVRGDSANIGGALAGKTAGVNVIAKGTSEDDEIVYHAPAPVTGQTAFDNYLRTKTINPENKYTGTVRVSFTVMPDGSLQDFRIFRHLNEICDAEAIRVIKEGPAWIPASDGKPAKVKVRVKFTAGKN
ncbi:energy transducer TonB [Chitinophaga sp. 22321]|uniref:Energy transducer TonB n=1 Tax=Chitinophaga hostae TaxID=2831022 RepID=A0ABS5J038_9BACT|nr:energy transducer TonB [Chitinophaga hostae]MBS0028401.1 energy transducer TonB [Chitinophaga hostae]